MTEKEIVQLAERQAEAINARDLDGYLSRIDDAYEGYSETAPEPISGPEGARQYLENLFRAFPDLQLEIQQVIVSGNSLAVRMRATGTHSGTFAGIAPTGRNFVIEACNVLEVRNGKVTRGRLYAENARLFQQLGVLSLPRTAAAG